MKRVEIDPNIRVHGQLTYTGFEDCSEPVYENEIVEVYESEAGLHGQGTVWGVDADKEIVYIYVDWKRLTVS